MTAASPKNVNVGAGANDPMACSDPLEVSISSPRALLAHRRASKAPDTNTVGEASPPNVSMAMRMGPSAMQDLPRF